MPKAKKTKKKTIEELHDILDNGKKINIENKKEEKYLNELKNRLNKSKHVKYKNISYKVAEGEKTLEPKVTVYPRGRQKVEIQKIKTKIELSKTEITFEEDFFEVEKSKTKEPEFLEVKPKIEKNIEPQTQIEENELKEWEAVEHIKDEIIEIEPKNEIIEIKIKSEDEDFIICLKCGEKIDKKAKFCHVCGFCQLEEPLIQNNEEKKEEIPEWEEAEIIDTKKEEKIQEKEIGEWEEIEIEENKPESVKKEEIGEWEETEIEENKPESVKKEEIGEWEETEIEDEKPDHKIKQEFENKKNVEDDDVAWLPITTTKEVWEEEPEELKQKEIKKFDNNFCPECGIKLDKKNKFCKNCGFKLIQTDITDSKSKEIELKELEKEVEEELIKEYEEAEKIFIEYDKIDRETAYILYINGINSVEDLKNSSYSDLKKIKGIKRKIAKKIINEINQKIQDEVKLKPIDIGKTSKKEVSEEEINKKEDIESDDWVIEEEIILDDDEDFEDEINYKKEFFNDFDSIDKDSAKILFESGYKSVEELLKTDKKDLEKIKGIKKKNLKKIIQEIEENKEWETIEDLSDLSIEEKEIKKDKKTKAKKKEKKITDGEKIIPFNDIESIDNEIAITLYDSGFHNINDIRKSSIKEIIKKTNLKKKKIKQINKEIKKILNSYDKKQEELITNEEFSEYLIEDDIKEDAKKIDERIDEYENNKQKKEENYYKEKKPAKKGLGLKDKYFKDIPSIDEKISELLILAGFDSVEKLRDSTISDLIKIKGIRRKIAKKIKKEVNKIPKSEESDEKVEWESFEEKNEKYFSYKGYKLYKKQIKTKNGKKRTIYFFSKDEKGRRKPIKLPKGYIVKVNKKTKVPYLKKEK